MNYDDVVLGTENPNHPANEKFDWETDEPTEEEIILDLEVKIATYELVLKHAIEVMESLPEDEQNKYLINKFKNVLR